MAEHDLVELVDDDGTAAGASTVAEAHQPPGLRHRAFSVVIHDGAGRVLLQRRAAVKLRFADAWGNTVCGHVAPGATVLGSAAARFAEELGVEAPPLREVGVHVYAAPDPRGPMVECEYDHVLVGRWDADHRVRPDPAEIAETRWVPLASWADDVAPHAPWLAGVLAAASAVVG